MRLVVATFKDERVEDSTAPTRQGREMVALMNWYFKNVPDGIRNATIEHLRKTALFSDVRPATFSSAEITRERLVSMADDADLVLTGSIGYFQGLVHRSDSANGAMIGAAAAGGMLGAVLVFGVDSMIAKDVEGRVALVNLELLDTKQGISLWKGEAEGHFRRNQKGLPEPADLALEALKAAVAKLVDQLRDFTENAKNAAQARQ
jgi:hypothetical protein